MNTHSSLEALESRIAPASLMMKNPTTATYTDSDGDLVTVKFSKGFLTAGNLAAVLVTTEIVPGQDQLQTIDLTAAGLTPAGLPAAAGTSITVTVTPKLPGDGFANIGYIKAPGIDVGAVTIRGDLGAIDAGDAVTKTPGLKGLTVQSLGVLGLTTGAPDLKSDIVGALSKLTVKGDMKDAQLDITGGVDGKDGKLPSVTIGGSLLGGSAARAGSIHTTGDLGTVKIAIDLYGGAGGAMGTTGQGAGALLSDGKMGAVTIGGTLVGGGTTVTGGEGAGVIKSGGDMGAISIGTNLIGGIGDNSGSIISGGKLASVKIGGNVQGGIVLIGGAKLHNGYIGSTGDMGKITIGGNLVGTFNNYAGTIESTTGKIAAVTIGGNMFGSSAHHSGSILAAKTIGAVKIAGDISGGSADSAGSIISGGDLPSITIGGGVSGGIGNKSGFISGVKLGTIKIGGSLGGAGGGLNSSFTDSGVVMGTSINSLAIGGGLFGGSAGASTLVRTGFITATTIKTLTIGGDVFGGSLSGAGSVTDSGSISADQIGKLVIGGSLSTGGLGVNGTGSLVRSGAITAGHDIKSLTVKGNIEGADDAGQGAYPVIISAVGQVKPTAKADVAIGSLTVGGHVTLSNILAGYSPAPAPVNGGAQIGTVSVAGDWSQSNLVAGAMNAMSGNKNFGNANDAAIATGSAAAIAKITSIKIGGVIGGTPSATNPNDHFGFVAHTIGGFFIGGTKITLPAGPAMPDIGATGDVSVHLI